MKVYLFGFDQTYAGSVVGVMDIFDQAKGLLTRQGKQSDADQIQVKLVSVDGNPISCQNDVRLIPHGSVKDIQDADIFIATSIHDVGAVFSKYRFMVDLVREQYMKGTALASICTGAFLLAETGLLDGKKAATHWSVSDHFQQRYPKVRLKTRNLVINPENLYCSEGASSSAELAFHLIEKHMGYALASKTAKYFTHNFKRSSKVTLPIYEAATDHNDLEVLKTQRWINGHLHLPLQIKDLSDIACMSPRTLERRFKKATGHTPSAYIQNIKVAQAKHRLETTNFSFERISSELGYMNCGSFRKIFVRWTSLLPSEYRQRLETQR